jgi:hypothetical protein
VTRFRPTLTLAQYRELVRLFRAEVAEIAWSLVVSPAPADQPRVWRRLSQTEAEDVFDRLIRAGGRMATTDRAKVDP